MIRAVPTPKNHSVGHALVGASRLVGALGLPTGMQIPQGMRLQGQGATSQPQLVDQGPTQARIQDLGFPTTTTTSSATANISSSPQVWFRADRVFIASSIVGQYTVGSILVGNKEQLLNGNPVPAVMYSELCVDTGVSYDTAQPAVSITIQVTNLDTTASHTVTPGMRGRAAY